MPFKVRAKLVAFLGDEEKFPCHFGYKIGDEITYDGEKFEGRVCPNLLFTMLPKVEVMMHSGNKHFDRIIYRYHGGYSVRDPAMKEHDGIGFRMAENPQSVDGVIFPRLGEGWAFVCEDARTSACFKIEPVDLATGGYFIGDYRRQMSILEKIRAEPGLTVDDILNKYSDFERNVVYPKLSPAFIEVMLDEMATVGYVELKDGRAYPGLRGK
ncbi:MAG: hypothetical protein A2144_11775 [Chloroflexi bacterium RBG_16_50_9]|nr:MAG: hypothetical protein A2144_11775 [Chloroflexi bacterium RBG_16_50_9]